MRVTLLPPAPAAQLPPLSDAQHTVATWRHDNLLVLGAPGSGKSVAALAALRKDPSTLLLLPTRVGAARTREVASAFAPPNQRVEVHTASALAFSVLRQLAIAKGVPAPTLLTGAAQDEILTELLAGHAEGYGVPLPWPEGLPREVLAIPAFRNELRDILARAAEFGLDGAALRERGRANGSPEWELAGALYEEYLDVVALADTPVTRGERYDSARILAEAASALEGWEGLTSAPAPTYGRIVVDDYQEATAAVVRLLHAVADRGGKLTLLAEPDVAVQTFRGARPQLVARADSDRGLGGFGAEVMHLPVVYRGGAALRRVVTEATSQIGPIAGGRRRRAASEGRGGAVRAVELRSEAAQSAFIASTLRSARLDSGLAWTDMSVIVRSDGFRDSLVSELRRVEVPAQPDSRRFVLRDERAVRPLLLSVEVAGICPDRVEAESAISLLLSPIGGLDTVAIRRLRRHLRREVREGAFGSLGEALAAVVTSEEAALALPNEFRSEAFRVARVVTAARAALEGPGRGPRAVLWAAWSASGLTEHWQEVALDGGARGERADADLDAVIALMNAAGSYEERLPGARVGQFVDWVRGLALPTDSLARIGQRDEGVVVLTAAEAAGREWPIVVIAGVQDGRWPDPRLRDSLLGSMQLADLELGRLGVSRESDRRHDVLDDEWRLFAAALSRASREVVVTAVRDDDNVPSVMFESVARVAGSVETPETLERVDLRGLVAGLRAELDADPASDAAVLLAALSAQDVPGADPFEWAGISQPSTIEPLPVATVSPSKVDLAIRCPLRWALETAGGRQASRIEANIGNLIHEIAAEYPHGTEAEMMTELEQRFGELELPEGWVARREFDNASGMVSLLALYTESVPGEVETEVDINVEIDSELGSVRIVGRVDRLEHVDGGQRIADLKTGNAKTVDEAAVDMQLGTYQLALGERSAGARLVYVKPERKSPAIRSQPVIPEEGGQIRGDFAQALQSMRSGVFTPVPNSWCSHCPVRTSCPAMEEGNRCAQ